VVQNIALVQLASRGWVESVKDETRAWPVLVHQLLALTHAHGGISAERCWQLLHKVPDFRGISEAEYLALVEHMKREAYLFEAGGLLSMGQKAERVFGRKNFLELYAVFSSPVLYQVETETGRALGSLEQNFVDRLVAEMSSFLLGGRAWVVLSLNHDERTVRVREAPRGKKPSWGGFVPQFLGFEVCQEMKAVLSSDDDYAFVDAKGKAALAEWRADLGQLLRRPGMALHADAASVTWWTFAGGRINQTLKYALEWKAGWKVIPDNFSIRIEGEGVSYDAARAQLSELAQPDFWKEADTRAKLRSLAPEYRLSKFQQVLPDRWQTEMIGNYLLDFEGAASTLG
jgi:ATP-dependent Lhr-like helicase